MLARSWSPCAVPLMQLQGWIVFSSYNMDPVLHTAHLFFDNSLIVKHKLPTCSILAARFSEIADSQPVSTLVPEIREIALSSMTGNRFYSFTGDRLV